MFGTAAFRTLIASVWLALWTFTTSPCPAGMVSLTFDDGLISVHGEAFPVLKAYNLKATVGMVVNRITSGNDDYMGIREAHELQDNGWEIASHGLTHQRPIDIPRFFEDEVVEGWELDGKNKKRGIYEVKYEYPAVAGLLENGKPLKEFAGLEDVSRVKGSYYFDRLAGMLHLHPFNPLNLEKDKIRSYSYQREMCESKIALEKLGFKVSTYITPYNYWTEEMIPVSKMYYSQVVNGKNMANRRDGYNPHWLNRFNILSMGKPEDAVRLIQKHAVEQDEWVIFCLHGIEDELGWEPWSAENLEELASWLQKNRIRVVTVAEGSALFSPVQQARKK